MLPHPEADYSYPEQYPIHIATKLSKYKYGLGYDQYFGGVVLLTKEQVEKTNGYSNDYWDWGQEDDDLFWRCYFEKYVKGDLYKHYENKTSAYFNGENAFISISPTREISSCLNKDHTISILFNAQQQPDKVPIWLVGDREKKFIEYPLLRKDGGWTWGLSFNNSRSINMTVFDKENKYHNNWAKKFENEWTIVTVTYDSETKNQYLYVNNELVTNKNGIKENTPYLIGNDLKSHDAVRSFLIGFCNHTSTFFRGKIADVKIYNTFFPNINDMFENEEDLVLNLDFQNDLEYENYNVTFTQENIDIINNVLPYRRESKFDCMFHVDEGYVGGRWAKGETTARNEKRFVTEMQQGLINYKQDGINNILNVLNIEEIVVSLYNNTKMINVKMK